MPAEQLDRSGGRAGYDGGHLAANFINPRKVADSANLQIRCWLKQKLTTSSPPVPVILLFVQINNLGVTVATVIAAVDREGDILGQRAGDIALENDVVVVAVNGFNGSAKFELRFTGNNGDHAGRSVFAEQRRLRAVQHLDALHIGKIGQRSR